MRLPTPFRIALGVVAALLGLWSGVMVVGTFLVPCECPMDTWQSLGRQVLTSIGFLAVAIGFALLARWCFTGRGSNDGQTGDLNNENHQGAGDLSGAVCFE
jgi:hypothetical protein